MQNLYQKLEYYCIYMFFVLHLIMYIYVYKRFTVKKKIYKQTELYMAFNKLEHIH